MPNKETDASSAPKDEVFDGRFTDSIRMQLRRKRLALGVSYQQLGSVLRLSWSTIHKWENGRTAGCHSCHIRLINNFLRGNFDSLVNAQFHNVSGQAMTLTNLPGNLRNIFERAMTVSRLCTERPEIGKRMLEELNLHINELIVELLNKPLNEQ